jgi:hypothetical protein
MKLHECRSFSDTKLSDLGAGIARSVKLLGYELAVRGIGVRFLAEGRIFFFSITSRLALGPTQPPIQRVPMAVSLGVKRPLREADHVHLVPRLRMVELYLHFPIRLHGAVLNKLSPGITLPLP